MLDIPLISVCPCGSQKKYSDCCEPLLVGQKIATTPEALMRSRYTAFAVKNIDYLFSSMTPELQQETDRDDMADFAEEVDSWVKLEVISAPVPEADCGTVEFAAYFMYEDEQQRIHENSKFIKQDGRWFYAGHEHQCGSHDHDDEQDDDENYEDHPHHVHDEHCNHHHHEPYRAEIKIGRNDPCPCGSGKKYKKCCID